MSGPRVQVCEDCFEPEPLGLIKYKDRYICHGCKEYEDSLEAERKAQEEEE